MSTQLDATVAQGADSANGLSIGAVLETLIAIPPATHHVLSCYLRLRPEDRQNQMYLPALRGRIATIEAAAEDAGLPRAVRLAIGRDCERILGLVSRAPDLPHARGMAVFACEALDLLLAVPLPRVHRDRLVLDDTASVGELLRAEADFGRIIAAVVDRTHARFFDVDLTGAEECLDIWDPASRGGKFRGDRRDAPGRGERRYHGRIREEEHRHYADIVRTLEQLARRRPIRGIVLAGPDEQLASLKRFLPRALAGQLLGTARVNPRAVTSADIQSAAFDVAAAHDARVAVALVAELREELGKDWAVDGARATLSALARGQLRRIFIRGDLAGGGFRCEATDRLAVDSADCRGEGESLPVGDLADEALEEALRQDLEVIVLDDPELAAAINGMAGVLRFR